MSKDKTPVQWLPACLLIVLTACSDSSAPPGPADADIQLALYDGDQQVGTAGAPLPVPLMVRVTDGKGRPLPHIGVKWQPEEPSDAWPNASITTTDSDGIARVSLTLGGRMGMQVTTAAVGARQIRFTSIAQIQGATEIMAKPVDAGSHQTDTVLSVMKPY